MGEDKHVSAPSKGRNASRRTCGLVALAVAAVMAIAPVSPAAAQSGETVGSGDAEALRTGSVTGLAIPRFVSLKADRVNMRKGPSRSHQVEWVLLKAGLPVEITAEFENWRRIRDFAGDEGWVFHTLLSGRRTVLFAPWGTDGDLIPLRRQPSETAPLAAQVGPRVLGDVIACENNWCELDLGEARGWAQQDVLWGVYPGEKVN